MLCMYVMYVCYVCMLCMYVMYVSLHEHLNLLAFTKALKLVEIWVKIQGTPFLIISLTLRISRI